MILHSLLKNSGAISNIKSFPLKRGEASEKLGCVSIPSSEMKNIVYKVGLISSYNKQKQVGRVLQCVYTNNTLSLSHLIMHLHQG